MTRTKKKASAPKSAAAAASFRAHRSAVQAKDMRMTREAHARELAEDYAEAIADLIAEHGEARITDLARKLGVTHVTVNRAISRLQQSGHVTAQPYRSIFLTEAGRRLAEESKYRHETVVRFLQMIGVPETDAHADAEGIEHHVSAETLKAFERALEKGGV